ncbi:MAG: esterase [Deltaproteobacteria bacterium]|nr:esterase [Deltaproteobacteria bacterium]
MSDQLYKGFRPDEMEYQYNPRESVPEYPELAKVRAAQAKKVRESAKSWLNVPYGDSPREMLDIYAADKPGGPVLIYIHGGYWRSGSKEDNCNFVPTFTKRGATVVLVEYDLCPQERHRQANPRRRRLGLEKHHALQRRSVEDLRVGPLRRRPSDRHGAGE